MASTKPLRRTLAERVNGAPAWTRGRSLAATLVTWLEQKKTGRSVMPTREEREERMRAALTLSETPKPLRSAALAVAEWFPPDWQSATLHLELERTAEGPSVRITYFEVGGEHSHVAGGSCG